MEKQVHSGRPPKFNEESRPITVTLPRRILRELEHIDPDRAKAIVKCVEQTTGYTYPEGKAVDVVQLTKTIGLIVVPPCRSLKSIPWLQLIEITPSRFLLALPSGTTIEFLEITLVDLIENLPKEHLAEKAVLMDLRQKLSRHRRKERLTKGEIVFINTGDQK